MRRKKGRKREELEEKGRILTPTPKNEERVQWRGDERRRKEGRKGTMDAITSNPAVFANAEILKKVHGRRVRTVVKVLQLDGGGILRGLSPDGQTITVRQVVKSEEFTPFLEIIGVVDGDLSLQFEQCTNFGDNFDMSNFNTLCQMANGLHQDIFI